MHDKLHICYYWFVITVFSSVTLSIESMFGERLVFSYNGNNKYFYWKSWSVLIGYISIYYK